MLSVGPGRRPTVLGPARRSPSSLAGWTLDWTTISTFAEQPPPLAGCPSLAEALLPRPSRSSRAFQASRASRASRSLRSPRGNAGPVSPTPGPASLPSAPDSGSGQHAPASSRPRPCAMPAPPASTEHDGQGDARKCGSIHQLLPAKGRHSDIALLFLLFFLFLRPRQNFQRKKQKQRQRKDMDQSTRSSRRGSRGWMGSRSEV